MKVRLLLGFLIFCAKSFSQAYVPIDTSAQEQTRIFLEEFKARHDANLERIKDEFKGEVRKKMKEFYGEAYQYKVKGFKKTDRLYFEKKNQEYLDKVVGNIVASNPMLKDAKLNVYFSRSTEPNAYSVGDGTIVWNLGFIDEFESEAEITGVLCHEISHFVLNHRDKKVKELVNNSTSKDRKKKEKEILNTKYGRSKQAEEFLKDYAYKENHHSREYELQADSLGFEFFKNTKFNSKHFASALGRLKDADKPKDSLVEADYRRFFTTGSQKFVEEWLQMEDFSKYNYSKKYENSWDIDSLRTHPHSEARVQKIAEQKYSDDKGDFQIDAAYFSKLKKDAKYERLANLYYSEKYGDGLYLALKLAKNDSENKFVLEMISKNLEKLAKAKKEMKLNRYIDDVDPTRQTLSYQRYINFMVNLSVKELERIADDYKKIAEEKKV